MGFPRWLTRMVPDVWDTVHRVGELEMPVLVVHSDVDDLFPLSMAERVVEACGPRGQLIVINGLSHNAPIFAPTEDVLAANCRVGQAKVFGSCQGSLPVARS